MVGGIPGYFDPFIDNESDLDTDAKPSSKLSPDDKVLDSLLSNSLSVPDLLKSSSQSAFMTHKGTAFSSVAERFGLTHLLDRCHFAVQILFAWHGISDPTKFQFNVYGILDTPSVDTLLSLLKEALAKYRTKKAQALLKKISSKQHQLC